MARAFTRAAAALGVRRTVPFLVALTPFGMVCGIAAQGQGLSLLEASLMSALVFAGSSQLLVLGQWAHPAPVLAAALTAFAVNLRMALMGPVLAPWLDRVRGWRLWGSLFMMVDQNWALSVQEMREGRGDAACLFGSGVLLWVSWVLTTIAGHALGAALRPPAGHPVFFAALAVFVAMLVTMWRGRGDALPWLVAAGVAVLVSRLLPGVTEQLRPP